MSIWTKVVGFFTGETGSKVVEKVADAADEAFHTQQERSEQDAKDTADARAYTAPSHGSWFDVLIDGMNRLVRPGVTLWLIGGFIGWWPLPKIETISEYWQNIFMLTITFWFGGRAILKDLPSAIRLMRGR